MQRSALLLAASVACGCEVHVDQATEIEYLQAPGTADLGLPFSSAVRVDDMLYLSGAIGVIPGTLELAASGARPARRWRTSGRPSRPSDHRWTGS